MSGSAHTRRGRDGREHLEHEEAAEHAAAMGNQAFAALARDAMATADPWAGQVVPGDLQRSIDTRRGGGQPLARDVASRMGNDLGDDLTDVRVHTDSGAGELARSVQARAFTTGRDVFFGAGEYRPGSSGGDSLLAHELAHVVQQRGTPATGALRVSTPGDAQEREADAAAGGTTVARATAPAPTVARDLLGSLGEAVTGVGQAAEEAAKRAVEQAKLVPLQAAVQSRVVPPLQGAAGVLNPVASTAVIVAAQHRLQVGADGIKTLPYVNAQQRQNAVAALAMTNSAQAIMSLLAGEKAADVVSGMLTGASAMIDEGIKELSKPGADGQPATPDPQKAAQAAQAKQALATASNDATNPELSWDEWNTLHGGLMGQLPEGNEPFNRARRTTVGALNAAMVAASSRESQVTSAKAAIEMAIQAVTAACASVPEGDGTTPAPGAQQVGGLGDGDGGGGGGGAVVLDEVHVTVN